MLLGIIIAIIAFIAVRFGISRGMSRFTWAPTFVVAFLLWSGLSMRISIEYGTPIKKDIMTPLQNQNGTIVKFVQYNRSNQYCEYYTSDGPHRLTCYSGDYDTVIKYDAEVGKSYLQTTYHSPDPKKVSWWICCPTSYSTTMLHLSSDGKGIVVEKWRSAHEGEMIREP
ncbi:MAG: hypothetical protein WCP93_04260 [Candidatus Berkelbacteria bacterium]